MSDVERFYSHWAALEPQFKVTWMLPMARACSFLECEAAVLPLLLFKHARDAHRRPDRPLLCSTAVLTQPPNGLPSYRASAPVLCCPAGCTCPVPTTRPGTSLPASRESSKQHGLRLAGMTVSMAKAAWLGSLVGQPVQSNLSCTRASARTQADDEDTICDCERGKRGMVAAKSELWWMARGEA